jgi:hypothetical protein
LAVAAETRGPVRAPMCRLDPPQRAPLPGCRDRGSGSYGPTGYEVGRAHICLETGARRDHHLALDSRALIRGFRVPAFSTVVRAPGPAPESLPRRKPRGGRGRFGERAYGDLKIAHGWRAVRRRLVGLGVFGGSGDGGQLRWRRCAGGRRSLRSGEGWRPRAGMTVVFRRLAAGGGGNRRCAAGCGATVMSCRS